MRTPGAATPARARARLNACSMPLSPGGGAPSNSVTSPIGSGRVDVDDAQPQIELQRRGQGIEPGSEIADRRRNHDIFDVRSLDYGLTWSKKNPPALFRPAGRCGALG